MRDTAARIALARLVVGADLVPRLRIEPRGADARELTLAEAERAGFTVLAVGWDERVALRNVGVRVDGERLVHAGA